MDVTDAEVAIAAAEAGARVVARDYGREHVRQWKSATDFATATDLDSERAVQAVLERHRPHDACTGEEFGRTGPADARRRWLVDPLCGTLNFAATTPLAAVNVALSDDGEVRVAASADPISGDLFWTDGTASYRRRDRTDELLAPTSRSGLIDVDCDGPLDTPFIGAQLVADPKLRERFGLRVLSTSLAVAWVAAGRRAAYVSDGQFRENVHFAAGIALCRAAGCPVSDLAGDPLYTGRGLVVSADRETQDAVLALIEPHLRELTPRA